MNYILLQWRYRDSENTEIPAFYRSDEGIPKNDHFRGSGKYHRRFFSVASVPLWLIHSAEYFKKVLASEDDFPYTLPE